jgi:hypothetical protein
MRVSPRLPLQRTNRAEVTLDPDRNPFHRPVKKLWRVYQRSKFGQVSALSIPKGSLSSTCNVSAVSM